ncbi:hypothetical protein GBA52_015655 [Prunus armeniaca]|nr:hypothetical protein GBA52_015655 [Prunus armeniaca]
MIFIISDWTVLQFCSFVAAPIGQIRQSKSILCTCLGSKFGVCSFSKWWPLSLLKEKDVEDFGPAEAEQT